MLGYRFRVGWVSAVWFNSMPLFSVGLIISGFLGLFINAIFRQALPRRSPLGALHYLRWINLKSYLKDYSLIKERPPESVVLWEKFLVVAVTLGVASQVEKAMAMVLPDKSVRSGIFMGSVNYHALNSSGFGGAISGFSSSFATASGTSGSGGFGGGGGGGGGGGRGGAGEARAGPICQPLTILLQQILPVVLSVLLRGSSP